MQKRQPPLINRLAESTDADILTHGQQPLPSAPPLPVVDYSEIDPNWDTNKFLSNHSQRALKLAKTLSKKLGISNEEKHYLGFGLLVIAAFTYIENNACNADQQDLHVAQVNTSSFTNDSSSVLSFGKLDNRNAYKIFCEYCFCMELS